MTGGFSTLLMNDRESCVLRRPEWRPLIIDGNYLDRFICIRFIPHCSPHVRPCDLSFHQCLSSSSTFTAFSEHFRPMTWMIKYHSKWKMFHYSVNLYILCPLSDLFLVSTFFSLPYTLSRNVCLRDVQIVVKKNEVCVCAEI